MYGKLAWEKYNDEQINDIMTFNEGYKNYITKGKTERLCVSETVKLAMAHGYKELNEVDILKPAFFACFIISSVHSLSVLHKDINSL